MFYVANVEKLKLNSLFSNRKLQQLFLLGAFVVCIAPFLVLSLYNHPSADDFCYTIYANSMDFWNVQLDHYLTWTGRYTATFLLTLSETDTNNLLDHRVLPVMLLILFPISIFFFFHKLLPHFKTFHKSCLTFLIFFPFMAGAPRISEAFYWKPGALTYQLALILGFIFFGLIISLRNKNGKIKILLTFLIALLGIFIIGLNETTMLMLCAILFLLVVVNFFRNKKIDPALAVILIFVLVAAVVVIKAPGNMVRMGEKTDNLDFDFSLTSSRELAKWFLLHQWLPLLIPLTMLFWGSLKRASSIIRSRFRLKSLALWHIVLYFLFFYSLVVLTFFPSFWSQGGAPPNRTINTIYLLSISGIFAFVVLLIIYLENKKIGPMRMSRAAKLFAVMAILLTIAEQTPNLRYAYSDLLRGRAERYDIEMQQRYALIEDCHSKECIVPPLENMPSTIFAYDLASEPSSEFYYYNECMEEYFGRKGLFASQVDPGSE